MDKINKIKENFKILKNQKCVKLNLNSLRLLDRPTEEVDTLDFMFATMAGLISYHRGVFLAGGIQDLRDDLKFAQSELKLTHQELRTLFYDVFDYGGVDDIIDTELYILTRKYK